MITDIREWMEEIWEYCQEHWIAAAAAGVVLLILLFSIGLTLTAKREDADPDEESADLEVPDLPEEPESEPVDAEPEAVEKAVPGVMEALMKQVEEASGAAGQKVESIELEIEKARLTIRYAGEGRTEETAAEPEAVPAEEPETADRPDVEILPSEEILQEPEILKEEQRGMKKFSAENRNMARSGRVYTEEELLKQIKD